MRNFKVREEATPSVTRSTYPVRAFGGIDAYNEENALPLGRAKEGYNVGVSVGTITEGVGISEPRLSDTRTLPQPKEQGLHFSQVFLYPRKNLAEGTRGDMFFARNKADGKLYSVALDSGEWAPHIRIEYASDVAAMAIYSQGGDAIMVCRPAGGVHVFRDDFYVAFSSIHLSTLCFQKGRAFGICPEENRLHYSALNNPTAWTVTPGIGGYLMMQEDGGRAMDAVAFGGAVYVIKENAIMQLKVYADPEQFVLTKMFETNVRIFHRTVAVGKDAMYFCTEDGLYRFDGYQAVKCFEGMMAAVVPDEHAHSVFFGKKYYLACNLKPTTEPDASPIGDEAEPLVTNGLIVFDTELGTASVLRGVDILWFCPVGKGVNSFVLVGFENPARAGEIGIIDESGALFGTALPKYWASGETDLQEPARYKILRRVHISTRHPLTLELTLDGKVKDYPLLGSKYAQTVAINKPVRRLKIALKTTAQKMYVRDMTLEVDLVRNYRLEQQKTEIGGAE